MISSVKSQCSKQYDYDLIKPTIILPILLVLIFIGLTMLSGLVYAENNQLRLKIVFDSIQINNKHESEDSIWPWMSDVIKGSGEWKMDVYVNEKRFPLSAGSGLNQVENGDKVNFVNKEITANIPSNGTLRLVSAGFEQDSENTILPDISDELKDAIPSIGIGGINLGGSNIAGMYNIAKKIVTYDKDDPIGIISKEYPSESNFGVGEHIDCAIANDNIPDLQRQQGTSCDFILKYRIIDVDHKIPPPSWHEWEKMDGVPVVISIPSAVSYIPGKFDLLALDQNGEFWLPYYDYGWKAPIEIPDQALGSQSFEPSTLQTAIYISNPDRLYLFALDVDNSLWYNFYNVETGKWHHWEKFGDSFISGPTVFKSSQDIVPKQINVYALKNDNYIYQRQFDLTQDRWTSNWDRMTFLGNEFSQPPALVLPKGTNDRLDAFGLLNNGSLWHGWFKAEAVVGSSPRIITWNLNGVEILSNFNFASQPSIISTYFGGPLDLYVQLSNNTLEHGTYNYKIKQWTKWEDMGKIYSNPIVTSPAIDRIDIFYLNNTSIMHKWYGR